MEPVQMHGLITEIKMTGQNEGVLTAITPTDKANDLAMMITVVVPRGVATKLHLQDYIAVQVSFPTLEEPFQKPEELGMISHAHG